MSEFAYSNVRAIKVAPPNEDLCSDQVPRDHDRDLAWFCTRPTGHDGLHVAHNLAELPQAAWNDTEQEEY